jgi:hypothetical protein
MSVLLRRLVPLAAFGLLAAGCVVESSGPYYADTQIQFDETRNIGSGCRGPLTDWTVYNRDTDKQATAGCSQPILFTNLRGNASYTFDIEGYVGGRLCWAGSCGVYAYPGERTYADCYNHISNLCGF